MYLNSVTMRTLKKIVSVKKQKQEACQRRKTRILGVWKSELSKSSIPCSQDLLLKL